MTLIPIRLPRARLAVLLASMLAAALPLMPQGASAAPFTFTFSTRPGDGALNGNPGQQIGWGYTLVNTDVANWFVPAQLSATSFSLGTMDAAYFDFPLLAPGQTTGMDFDAALLQGLYGVLLSAGAVAGNSESGDFTLSGEWWSGDPFGGGAFLQNSDAVTAGFSVQVGATAVPLPSTVPLLVAGGLVLLAFQRRRQEGGEFGSGLR